MLLLKNVRQPTDFTAIPEAIHPHIYRSYPRMYVGKCNVYTYTYNFLLYRYTYLHMYICIYARHHISFYPHIFYLLLSPSFPFYYPTILLLCIYNAYIFVLPVGIGKNALFFVMPTIYLFLSFAPSNFPSFLCLSSILYLFYFILFLAIPGINNKNKKINGAKIKIADT